MIDVLFADEQVILAATALMPSVMALMNWATLPRAALSSSIMNATPLWQISFKAAMHPQPRGQIICLL